MNLLLSFQDVAAAAATAGYTAGEVLTFFAAGGTMDHLIIAVQAAAIDSRYTATEVVTIIASVGVLLAGVGAIVVNIIVALRQGAKLDASLAKTTDLSHQVQEVHTLTNSNLSAVKAELATATAQIAAMRDLVTDLKTQRGKAELTAAFATPTPPGAGDRAGNGVQQLDKIETNTAQTATNTARTDETVEALKKERS